MSGSPTPGDQMWKNKNVYEKPLHQFSVSPMTGAFRDGYCRSGDGDPGNHSVAASVTQEFLDFTASRGNNLSSLGLKPGTKWCLCASRWKEALQAAKSPNDPIVPPVFLHATSNEALKEIDFKDLKKYASEGETGGSQSGRAPRGMAGSGSRQTVISPNKTGGIARDDHPDVQDHPDRPQVSKEYRGA